MIDFAYQKKEFYFIRIIELFYHNKGDVMAKGQ